MFISSSNCQVQGEIKRLKTDLDVLNTLYSDPVLSWQETIAIMVHDNNTQH